MTDRLLDLAADEHIQLILLGIVNLFMLLVNQHIARETRSHVRRIASRRDLV